jgi:hypothetical protein
MKNHKRNESSFEGHTRKFKKRPYKGKKQFVGPTSKNLLFDIP